MPCPTYLISISMQWNPHVVLIRNRQPFVNSPSTLGYSRRIIEERKTKGHVFFFLFSFIYVFSTSPVPFFFALLNVSVCNGQDPPCCDTLTPVPADSRLIHASYFERRQTRFVRFLISSCSCSSLVFHMRVCVCVCAFFYFFYL